VKDLQREATGGARLEQGSQLAHIRQPPTHTPPTAVCRPFQPVSASITVWTMAWGGHFCPAAAHAMLPHCALFSNGPLLMAGSIVTGSPEGCDPAAKLCSAAAAAAAPGATDSAGVAARAAGPAMQPHQRPARLAVPAAAGMQLQDVVPLGTICTLENKALVMPWLLLASHPQSTTNWRTLTVGESDRAAGRQLHDAPRSSGIPVVCNHDQAP
jgi:hypothetical protein